MSSAARYPQTSMLQLQDAFDSTHKYYYDTNLCQERCHVWDAIDIKATVSNELHKSPTFLQKLEYIIPQLRFFRPWYVYLMEFA